MVVSVWLVGSPRIAIHLVVLCLLGHVEGGWLVGYAREMFVWLLELRECYSSEYKEVDYSVVRSDDDGSGR